MGNRAITTESCSSEDMSYYVMVRQTIHGLDNLITNHIHHSVTIITAALGLAVALPPIIQDPYWSKAFLFIATVVAFILTLGSHQRVNLYSGLLTEQVTIAKELEDELLTDDSMKVTQRIEKNVQHAGEKGKNIFNRGIKAFYFVEAIISLYLVYWLMSLFLDYKVPF